MTTKIKTYSLVNNYFQIHLITGEFEIEEDVGLSHVSNMLERLGDAIVIGFDNNNNNNKKSILMHEEK